MCVCVCVYSTMTYSAQELYMLAALHTTARGYCLHAENAQWTWTFVHSVRLGVNTELSVKKHKQGHLETSLTALATA